MLPPTARPTLPGFGRDVAITLLVVALGLWAITAPSSRGAVAATNAGRATVIVPADGRPGGGMPLTSGASATEFSLGLPAGAACTGDSANDSYLWQTYMVPAAVDPSTLTFDANGPVPFGTGASFRQPLYGTDSSPIVNQLTAPASPAPGPGPVVNIPPMTLAVYQPGDAPAGTYNLGVACTLGPASATQVDKYWNLELVITTDGADVPAAITWQAAPTTTSSSSTTSTSVAATSSSSTSSTSTSSSSSSSSSSTTSTTISSSSSSSSTTAPSTTSSTSPSSTSSTSTTIAATVTSTTVATGFAGLARTGSSLWIALWSLLLLDLGWWVVRRGRRPRPTA